ncbi:MAG: hypothetical protein CR979_00270 [Propionibacterium sp.]|nr:MAG: hypothetical protein CR979_00270 [Propionibacterium sp.]
MITFDSAKFPKTGFQNFQARFHPGTINALIGGDGAGKTSLLRILSHPRTRKQSGLTIAKDEVGYQSATSGVWSNLSVAENLEFVGKTYGLTDAVFQERSAELLKLAQLDNVTDRIAYQLSGGMRQKLGVLMTLLVEPSLLLLDEPTTGVDVESRETIWKLIVRAKNHGATVLVATTYLDEAEQADQVLLLENSQLICAGSPAEVIAATPGHIWQNPIDNNNAEQLLVDDTHWRRGNTHYHWRADNTRPAAMTAAKPDLELATIANLLSRKKDTEKTAEFVELEPESSEKQLVKCSLVSKKFGDFVALIGVSMAVSSGEIVGLIGGNGAGKSTLIRIILGLDKPTTGDVQLFGIKPSSTARANIGYVPQSLGLYPALLPQENLDFTMGIFTDEKAPRIYSDIKTTTGQLPLGTQRNVAVQCALSHSPKLLILDEPTSGMDPLSRTRLWKQIRAAANNGIGVLITTHYQQEAQQCDRLIYLEAGRVVNN